MLSLFNSDFLFRRRSDYPRCSLVRCGQLNGRARGFTLLELLCVIALVTLLCGMMMAVGHRAHEAGCAARARAELAALSVALEEYRRNCGDYPQTNEPARFLQSLIGRLGPRNEPITSRCLLEVTRFATSESLDPFASDSVTLIDPWGQPYRYAYKTQAPWNNASYVLYSIGPDGQDSGTLLAGGLIDSAPAANADNLYAGR